MPDHLSITGERARPTHPDRVDHAADDGAFLRDPDGNRVAAVCHLSS